MPKPTGEAELQVVPTPANDRRQRRRFTSEDRLRIVREADACTERGQIGALLRREGIYSHQLQTWRAQRDQGARAALEPHRPGPPAKQTEQDRRIADLERQLAAAQKENRILQGLVDLQRKAHEILGEALPKVEETSSDGSSSSSHSGHRRFR